MFSKLIYTRTNFWASLAADQMESLLHILEQGFELENYDITNAVRLWHNCKDRHPNQKSHHNYREHGLKKPCHRFIKWLNHFQRGRNRTFLWFWYGVT